MTELYVSENAQQILQIAIAKETEAGELTRTQLMEIAAELNISSETMQLAEQEWRFASKQISAAGTVQPAQTPKVPASPRSLRHCQRFLTAARHSLATYVRTVQVRSNYLGPSAHASRLASIPILWPSLSKRLRKVDTPSAGQKVGQQLVQSFLRRLNSAAILAHVCRHFL